MLTQRVQVNVIFSVYTLKEPKMKIKHNIFSGFDKISIACAKN